MAHPRSQLEDRIQNKGYQLAEVDIPLTFYDKDNQSFHAKSDAVMIDNGKITIIEFKSDALNNKTCIKSCKNKLLAQCNYHKLSVPLNTCTHTSLSARLWLAGKRKDCLDSGWNHSRVKQKLVNDGLKKVNIDFLVVFERHPPKIKKNKFLVFFQLFYSFPSMTLTEFEMKYKDATFLNTSDAEMLISNYLK